ncbi:ABC transporter permease [Corynebacterium epidermidicanis]|uniref:ABC-2 family transporter protein n=1 Tax=Corynebacterium epidermidicanis TaxID=1050174 RepID=A0A0G3GPT2_9CORY|nr:ABC transporter permease [Corynebacterium epidermidicanis]AKK03201.1 ABC-2 family transporter protein [Corynebacterium epidermidicanis]
MSQISHSQFSPGTFAPWPQRASIARMICAQALIEAKLFLRHGEQQLLSLIIPAGFLIGLTFIDILGVSDPVSEVFPFSLALAGMSAGFTGQAIAVAFDRRYGALKRIGASGVPSWTIIFGKVVAVLGVAAIQTLILLTLALVLGWRTNPLYFLGAIPILILGVMAFTALGLALGGRLSSEMVLATANLAWFLLLGAAAYAMFRTGGDPHPMLSIIPSVAFAEAVKAALSGDVAWADIFSLAVWTALASTVATKLFRFTM